MKKILLTLAVFTAFCSPLKAQVLFTYGGKAVSQQEFMASFNKNNTDTSNRLKALENYRDLYIRFRLKVQAAHDLKMDTLPNQNADLKGFEEQIRPMYMLDQQTLEELVATAHERSLKEVSVKHLFIAFNKLKLSSNVDTNYTLPEKELARKKAASLKASLLKGEDFEQLIIANSDDPEVSRTRGYLGYITAFSLPHAFENAIYALKDWAVSDPIETANGIHFFQRMNTRAAHGKTTIAQVLIAKPEDATNEEMRERKLLADSIHALATAGASFDSLVLAFSNDMSSAQKGGIIEDIQVGKYDPLFEELVMRLKKDGEIAPVLLTDLGFHIIKRISNQPIEQSLSNTATALKELILQDDRKSIAAEAFIKKSIGKHGLTASMANKEDYIAKRLEQFNPAYATQIKDFKDGNLLFEIMDKKVWGKASTDLQGLKKFHAGRATQYTWKQSVFAVTITAQNKETALAIREAFEKDRSVEQIKKMFSEVSFVDSGRYEAGELLGVGAENAKRGFVTPIYTNPSDESASFIIVVNVFKDPSTKRFEEARGTAINDYQQYLEDLWIGSLKKKYPVVMNAQTWKTLLSGMH
jgi:peptidyl-prolyl cis-trans isomerase SurA